MSYSNESVKRLRVHLPPVVLHGLSFLILRMTSSSFPNSSPLGSDVVSGASAIFRICSSDEWASSYKHKEERELVFDQDRSGAVSTYLYIHTYTLKDTHTHTHGRKRQRQRERDVVKKRIIQQLVVVRSLIFPPSIAYVIPLFSAKRVSTIRDKHVWGRAR